MLTQSEYRNLKTRLTRARNSGNAEKVLSEATRALGIFEVSGYPDDWHRWQRAADDARMTIAFNGKGF